MLNGREASPGRKFEYRNSKGRTDGLFAPSAKVKSRFGFRASRFTVEVLAQRGFATHHSLFAHHLMEPVEYPIDGVLDLHQFDPGVVGSLVPEYLRACREKGILRVRIIHGKGTGRLRQSVHAILDRQPEVASYHLAKDSSGWGATIAKLHPVDE